MNPKKMRLAGIAETVLNWDLPQRTKAAVRNPQDLVLLGSYVNYTWTQWGGGVEMTKRV